MGIITYSKCLLGKCTKDQVIREEWLPKDETHQTVRLLRFFECPICHATRSTITSPETEETRFSEPEYWMVNQPAQQGAKS